MRFNARQVREAKQKAAEQAVRDAKASHLFGRRFIFAFGLASGLVLGLWASYVSPETTKVWGDALSKLARKE